MKTIFLITAIFLGFTINAQNKSGNTIIFGGAGVYAIYNDTARPTTGMYFPGTSTYDLIVSTSNICDSASGELLFMCNGARIWDTLGNIIENGDTIIPTKEYTSSPTHDGWCTQGSLILPKSSNGLYYVFTPAITDSAYTTYVTGGQNKVPFDLLQYHIVDMNANGGMGKVIQKNMHLLSNVEMSKVGMMACRHANGYD